MSISEIYFWEAELNPHRLPLTRALARRDEIGRVIYIAEKALNPDRVRQGLNTDTESGEEFIIAPSGVDVARIVAQSAPDSIHVFSGMHWVPCIVEGIRHAAREDRFFGLMSEPRVLEGWRGKLRLLHSWSHERLHRRHAAFVAAIGRHGPRWFHLTGYGRRVFPFAYFIDPPTIAPQVAPPQGNRPRIGYVGRLNASKGFGLFLQMIEAAQGRFDFVIAGSGPLEPDARDAAARHANVQFLGVVPMAEVPSTMARLDFLVVPSLTTDDGWAVVVSEALFTGTLPIIGGRVGASVLADGDRIALRVDTDDPRAYLAALDTALAAQATSSPARANRSAYAEAHLSADAGAEYFVKMLAHFRDGAPRPKAFYI